MMMTINIMKLDVNTISNIGSLNIGKAIVCYNRALSTEVSDGSGSDVDQASDSVSSYISPAVVSSARTN